jgi:hypothetical protein
MDYAALQQDAINIITAFADPTVVPQLKKLAAITYNPNDGTSSGTAPAVKDVYAVLVPWTEEYIDGKKFQWNQAFKDGTLIEYEEIRCLMAPLAVDGSTLDPKLGDSIVFQSKEYVIVKDGPLKPAGTAVLFDMTVRG